NYEKINRLDDSEKPHRFRLGVGYVGHRLRVLIAGLLQREPRLDTETLEALFDWLDTPVYVTPQSHCLSGIVRAIENYSVTSSLSSHVRKRIRNLFNALRINSDRTSMNLAHRLSKVLGEDIHMPIKPDEIWSNALIA